MDVAALHRTLFDAYFAEHACGRREGRDVHAVADLRRHLGVVHMGFESDTLEYPL